MNEETNETGKIKWHPTLEIKYIMRIIMLDDIEFSM